MNFSADLAIEQLLALTVENLHRGADRGCPEHRGNLSSPRAPLLELVDLMAKFRSVPLPGSEIWTREVTSVTGHGPAAVARWWHEDHRPHAGEGAAPGGREGDAGSEEGPRV